MMADIISQGPLHLGERDDTSTDGRPPCPPHAEPHTARLHLWRIGSSSAQIDRPDPSGERSHTDRHEELSCTVFASHRPRLPSSDLARRTPARRNVVSHRSVSTENGNFKASRFGNTRMAWPGTSSCQLLMTKARNTRLMRFRQTAFPNRCPTIIPTRDCSSGTLLTRTLKHSPTTRRPCRLTVSMARLSRRNTS